MSRLEGSGGVDDGRLQRKYQQLQREWNSYKESAPPRRRRRSISSLASAAPRIAKLFSSSPKELISSLQRGGGLPSSTWGVRSGDRGAEEIVVERRAAIMAGKLRGRRLLEALEGAWDDDDDGPPPGEEETCSEMGSSSCCCTWSRSSYSSSSGANYGRRCAPSPSFSPESTGGETAVGARASEGGGGRRVLGVAWLAVVLVVFSLLGVPLLMESYVEEHGDCLFLT